MIPLRKMMLIEKKGLRLETKINSNVRGLLEKENSAKIAWAWVTKVIQLGHKHECFVRPQEKSLEGRWVWKLWHDAKSCVDYSEDWACSGRFSKSSSVHWRSCVGEWQERVSSRPPVKRASEMWSIGQRGTGLWWVVLGCTMYHREVREYNVYAARWGTEEEVSSGQSGAVFFLNP